MQKATSNSVRVFFLICSCVFGGLTLAAQPPTPPAGFEPASSVTLQEQLPAAPLVIAAYSIVWVLVCVYVWSVWRRIQRAERDLADVRRRIPAGERR
jgi:CcmD family protein